MMYFRQPSCFFQAGKHCSAIAPPQSDDWSFWLVAEITNQSSGSPLNFYATATKNGKQGRIKVP